MIYLSKKVAYLLQKTLVLSIICNRCKNKGQKSFKKDKSFGKYIYLKYSI